MSDLLEYISKPNISLLVKLGSIVVHVEELLSPSGHGYDKIALEQLLSDPEVKTWCKEMDKFGMLPVKRCP